MCCPRHDSGSDMITDQVSGKEIIEVAKEEWRDYGWNYSNRSVGEKIAKSVCLPACLSACLPVSDCLSLTASLPAVSFS